MKIFLAICFLSLLTIPAFAQDNSLTLTTYYPAPAGAYDSLRASKMCIGTNCHHGTVATDNGLYVQGNLGIGTTTPLAPLHVAGPIRIGTSTITCTSANDGLLRYKANQFEYCNGATSIWQTMGGSPAGTLCGFQDPHGSTALAKCNGHAPLSSCPAGYTRKKVAQAAGNDLYSCIKN